VLGAGMTALSRVRPELCRQQYIHVHRVSKTCQLWNATAQNHLLVI